MVPDGREDWQWLSVLVVGGAVVYHALVTCLPTWLSTALALALLAGTWFCVRSDVRSLAVAWHKRGPSEGEGAASIGTQRADSAVSGSASAATAPASKAARLRSINSKP